MLRVSCFLLAASLAIGEPVERQVLYTRTIFPPTWNLVGRASSHQRMHFIVAVKQRAEGLKALEEKFWAVSDPDSPQWRQHMSVEEISALVKADDVAMRTVVDWLKEGLPRDSTLAITADAVEVRCSMRDVERLFETEINMFVHDNGHTVLRSIGPHSVPLNVHAAVDFVEGIADFPMHRASGRKVPKREGMEAPQAAIPLVAPQTLKETYKVPADYTLSKVSQGPAEFQDDTSYNKEDLVTFFKQSDLTDQKVSEIVGPYNGAMPDTEATLDVQYISSVGAEQTNWYWTADNWMYQWSHNFFNAKTVPDAVSISWGWAEDQQCSSGISQAECQTLGIDSKQYVTRVNTEFMKIGLRGVSLLVASGDSGANGRSDGMCTGKVLHASFPGSSPYVTAVGATQFSSYTELKTQTEACSSQGSGYKCASGGVEVAVSSSVAGFTSGGGFSTYTPQPSWQKEAVAAYLREEKASLPPASYFNASNRGYPDIAALGNNFLIYMSGWVPVGGTSAATPTVAGAVAYLNDYSNKHGGKTLGFLNPFLYKMHAEAPDAFTDVTVGDNKCTEDGCAATCKGYKAAKGWDPVTGLGTPVVDKMLSYLGYLLSRTEINV